MIGSFVVAVVLALVWCEAAVAEGPAACSSFEPIVVDLKWLIEASPQYAYRSTSPLYKCTQGAIFGPAGDSTDYSGSAAAFQNNYTFTVNFKLVDNRLFEAVYCANGAKTTYKLIHLNSTGRSSSLCAAVCNAKDDTKFDFVTCLGRTSADEADIQKFLDTQLKGVEGIENTQIGCTKPKYCNFFTN